MSLCSMYPSSPVLVIVEAILMVLWTWHQQSPLTASVVLLLPLRVEPLVHYALPAHGIITTPPRRNLHVIKCMTSKKRDI